MLEKIINEYFNKIYEVLNKELKKIYKKYWVCIDKVTISDVSDKENKFELLDIDLDIRVGHLDTEQRLTITLPGQELDNYEYLAGVIGHTLNDL